MVKIQWCINIDLENKLEAKKQGINVSEICNNAIGIACKMEKPKNVEDISLRLIKIESEKSQLLKLIEKQKEQEFKLSEKQNKEKFKEELIKLRKIRFKFPNQFHKFRLEFEKEYNIGNAELMKLLDKN